MVILAGEFLARLRRMLPGIAGIFPQAAGHAGPVLQLAKRLEQAFPRDAASRSRLSGRPDM